MNIYANSSSVVPFPSQNYTYPSFVDVDAPRTTAGSFLILGGTWASAWTPRINLPRQLKAAVWNMTWGHCFYCGTNYMNPFETFIIEHVVPLSRGGTNEIENLVPACEYCNEAKGTLFLDEWRIARPYGDDPDEYGYLREWLDENGQPAERPPGLYPESRLTNLFFFERWESYQRMREDEIRNYNRMLARLRQGAQ